MQNQVVRKGFFFLANRPFLDFLNTRPFLNGAFREFLTDFSALVRWFLAAGLIEKSSADVLESSWSGAAQSRAAVERALSFRERMRSAVLALESTGKFPQGAVNELNDLLKRYPTTFQLVKISRRLTKTAQLCPKDPEDLFGVLVNLAADVFSDADLLRIRKCETCVLHFYDTTKNGTRRWCSMNFCGNRAKVASYAARHRNAG